MISPHLFDPFFFTPPAPFFLNLGLRSYVVYVFSRYDSEKEKYSKPLKFYKKISRSSNVFDGLSSLYEQGMKLILSPESYFIQNRLLTHPIIFFPWWHRKPCSVLVFYRTKEDISYQIRPTQRKADNV